MSKRSQIKPNTTTRTALPLVEKDKKGSTFMCPFCKPSHPISPFALSPCGTMVEVRATQEVIRARYDKKIKCAKCGEGGGDVVRWQNAYVHVHDCAPDIKTLSSEPKFSNFAKMVYNLSDGLFKRTIQRYMGRAVTVDEVTPDGKRTGVILGYFFHKGP